MRFLMPVLLSLILTVPTAAFVRADDKNRQPVCSVCNMKIGEAEKKFSVALPNVSGMGPSSFDDIGCALISRNNECATRQLIFDGNAAAFDFETGDAVPLEKAYFAFKTSFRTPMGYGIVAFREKAQAEKFAAEHGKVKVVRWFELVDMKL